MSRPGNSLSSLGSRRSRRRRRLLCQYPPVAIVVYILLHVLIGTKFFEAVTDPTVINNHEWIMEKPTRNSTIVSRTTASCSDTMSEEECCLMDDECLQETARRIARVWNKKPLKGFCSPHQGRTADSTPAHLSSIPTGESVLWLIKVPKSASSTMAGLVLRIADRNNCSTVYWAHGSARQHNLSQRVCGMERQRLFLFAPIRNPNNRALSDIYFHRVSLQAKRQSNAAADKLHHDDQPLRRQPSDSFVIKGLEELQGNYITEYTRLSDASGKHMNAVHVVQSILNSYDYLFLVEEMTKSMVVFAWLTELPIGDLMVTSSKQSGSWYSQKKRCVRLIPPLLTPSLQNFMESNKGEWKRKHMIDRLLHASVQASLHKTIEQHIGLAQVDKAVKGWKQLQIVLGQACFNETFWPCTSNGSLQLDKAKQSCYARDFGCGHACYDRQFSILPQLNATVDTLWS